MEHTQSSPVVGDETKRQLPALENVSQHMLIAALKANIRMREQGLGLIIIQNGPYLQITSLVEKSSAAKDGKLKPELLVCTPVEPVSCDKLEWTEDVMMVEQKEQLVEKVNDKMVGSSSGDVLIKIGHTNVLGWTLRELKQLLHNIPIGTALQIRVYRDFVEVPQHWQKAVELIPEVKLPVMTADTCEDTEDEDNTTSSSDDDADLETFQYKSSQSYCCEFTQKLRSISDICQTLRVGTDAGCDVVLHNYVDALCNPKFDARGLRPPSYWATENKTSSTSPCPSASDTSYLEELTVVSE